MQNHHLQAPRLHIRHDHISHRLILPVREHDLRRFVSPIHPFHSSTCRPMPKHVESVAPPPTRPPSFSLPPQRPLPTHKSLTSIPQQATQPTPAPPPPSSPTSSCSPTSSSPSTTTNPSAKPTSPLEPSSPAKAARTGSGSSSSSSCVSHHQKKYHQSHPFRNKKAKSIRNQSLHFRYQVANLAYCAPDSSRLPKTVHNALLSCKKKIILVRDNTHQQRGESFPLPPLLAKKKKASSKKPTPYPISPLRACTDTTAACSWRRPQIHQQQAFVPHGLFPSWQEPTSCRFHHHRLGAKKNVRGRIEGACDKQRIVTITNTHIFHDSNLTIRCETHTIRGQ